MQVNPKITFFVPDFENPIETSFISSDLQSLVGDLMSRMNRKN